MTEFLIFTVGIVIVVSIGLMLEIINVKLNRIMTRLGIEK